MNTSHVICLNESTSDRGTWWVVLKSPRMYMQQFAWKRQTDQFWFLRSRNTSAIDIKSNVFRDEVSWLQISQGEARWRQLLWIGSEQHNVLFKERRSEMGNSQTWQTKNGLDALNLGFCTNDRTSPGRIDRCMWSLSTRRFPLTTRHSFGESVSRTSPSR